MSRAAKFYIQNQVEAGHCCPITMTSAVIPALRQQPDIAVQWESKILARHYDNRNVPPEPEQKTAVTFGMAMTEKQGGSDVRTNTTRAWPHWSRAWRDLGPRGITINNLSRGRSIPR